MHKGSLPQPDDRIGSDGKTTYRGLEYDPWKVLWRPPKQKHWNAEIGFVGAVAAETRLSELVAKGNEAYRYRI